MKPKISETTGSPSPARTGSSLIGPQHGEPGFVAPQTEAQRVDRLLSDDVEANTSAVIASLTQRLGWSIKPVIDRKYPNDGPVVSEIAGYQIAGAKSENRAEALRIVRAAMTPAPEERVIGWLAELSVQVAFRQKTEFTGELTLKVYARNLADYPADVGRETLSAWPKNNKWWPTWHELHTELERRCKPRKALLFSVTSKTADEPEKAEKKEAAPDPNVAAQMEAMVAELAAKRQVKEAGDA